MPVHDWTRTTAGTFHDFHLAWIAEMRRALNGGLLPGGYYALAEQVAGDVIPDVLTLQEQPESYGARDFPGSNGGGLLAVLEAPPRVAVTDSLDEAAALLGRQRQLVIRHTTGDRIVALVEIVSPGNKERAAAFDSFLDKSVAALRAGYHLLILDLFPPGPFDPAGIHGALWERIGGRPYQAPVGRPLTLAAYAAGPAVKAYVEPLAVGDALAEMPLFLESSHYVNVPLEATYRGAWEGVPQRWRSVIERER